MTDFKSLIKAGIPTTLPEPKKRSALLSHAPKRKAILNTKETQLALKNALRYFPSHFHQISKRIPIGIKRIWKNIHVSFYARL